MEAGRALEVKAPTRQWCGGQTPALQVDRLGLRPLLCNSEKQTWRLQPRPSCLQDARRTGPHEPARQKCGPSRERAQSTGSPAPAPGTSSRCPGQAFHPQSEACLNGAQLEQQTGRGPTLSGEWGLPQEMGLWEFPALPGWNASPGRGEQGRPERWRGAMLQGR